ncbi:MAG: hypothetical protein AAGJ29_09845 [Pseudomonadota bacterium]
MNPVRYVPLLMLLSGCASVDNLFGGFASAPEWFNERRVEIRGEGYPKLRDVPVADDFREVSARMREGGFETEEARFIMENHPRAELSPYTPYELASFSAPLLAQLPDIKPDPEALYSADELAAFQEQLVVPPAR